MGFLSGGKKSQDSHPGFFTSREYGIGIDIRISKEKLHNINPRYGSPAAGMAIETMVFVVTSAILK
jgi:hypothetical protein